MICECGGKTKVLERRGLFRRRECLTCKKRFSTQEIVIVRARQKQVVRTRPEGEPKPRPAPKPKINAAPEIKHKAQLVQNRAARNRLEDMREEREMRGLLDDYDTPDHDRF